MPGSLKEALRKALEEDDLREKVTPPEPPIVPIEETVERTEMTFEEQAGELIPQEVGE